MLTQPPVRPLPAPPGLARHAEFHETRGRSLTRTSPIARSTSVFPGPIGFGEWQNYESTIRNRLQFHLERAIKQGTHPETFPSWYQPPSRPLPKPTHEQVVDHIRDLYHGDWPLASEPNLPLTLTAADFTREPRRAPDPPKRVLRPPSELFLPPMPSIVPVFQDRIPQDSLYSSQEAKATRSQTNLQIPFRDLLPKCSPNHPDLLSVQPNGQSITTSKYPISMSGTRVTLNTTRKPPRPIADPRGKPLQQMGRSSTAPPSLERNSSLNWSQSYDRHSPSLNLGPRMNGRITKIDRLTTVKRQSPTSNLSKVERRDTIVNSFNAEPSTRLRDTNTKLEDRDIVSKQVQNDLSLARNFIYSERMPNYTLTPRQRRNSESISPKRITSNPPVHDTKVIRRNIGQQRDANARKGGSVTGGFDFDFGRVSLTNLAVIPENARTQCNDESNPVTPVTTKISLRSGSTVTVVPCEATAWRSSIYLHGPIKLPKPIIVPRKNSLATLDPFQEAVDQIYQQALTIPRRESDSLVEHDICDFFDSFGFERVGFEDSDFDGKLCATKEDDGVEATEFVEQHPPTSPLERRVAKESVICVARPSSSREGVDVQEISSYARKESLTLGGRDEAMVDLLTPLPEEGMLRNSYRMSKVNSLEETNSQVGSTNSSGFDWDDDVSEIEAAPIWVAPTATTPKSHPLNRDTATKRTRNPVARLRRLVATASAIL